MWESIILQIISDSSLLTTLQYVMSKISSLFFSSLTLENCLELRWCSSSILFCNTVVCSACSSLRFCLSPGDSLDGVDEDK